MDSLMTFYGQFSCKLSGYAICDSLVARGIDFTADQGNSTLCCASCNRVNCSAVVSSVPFGDHREC